MTAASARRFALIGCGSIGKRHLKNLIALGETDLVAFDPREDRRAEIAAFSVRTVATLEELWAAAPSVVLVTSPTTLHAAHTLAAVSYGAHVFVEKPASDKHDSTLDEIITHVREKKLVTLVGCNLRFHPGLLRTKQLLESGRLGNVVSIRAEFGQYLPDWHPWEDYRKGYSARKDLGGGVVLDAIHELDYVRWLIGEVSSVAALTSHRTHIEIDTEDTASILLRFASGIFGEVHLDYVQRAYTRVCVIVGDEGTLVCDLAKGGEIRIFDATSKGWETIPPPEGWSANDMYVEEMKHFVACLRGEQKPMQDVAEATRVLDIALAAKASAASERFMRPTDLPR